MSEKVPQNRSNFSRDKALGLGGKGSTDIFNDLGCHVIHGTLFLEMKGKRWVSMFQGNYQSTRLHPPTTQFKHTDYNKTSRPGEQ